MSAPPGGLPSRLHHHAFVVKDQAATRQFYEGVLGLPLIATWTETDDLGGTERAYCHTFYGLADGSALAFFQFADDADQERFAPPPQTNPYLHVALRVDQDSQDAIKARLDAAEVGTLTIDHGYCVSLYVADPDGLIVELTCDHPDVEEINRVRRESAGADLDRWLAGDHRNNNAWRRHATT